ncbi:MAG: hypothetical protein ACUVQ0_05280 [Thermoproteota archaeon]
MLVQAALVGSFPRPFKIGRLMNRYRDGKVDKNAYEEKLDSELERIISKIAEMNIPLILDSMFLWDDIFEPFASSFEGLERGGLYRFLDNNFYYRTPVVKGRIKHRDATSVYFKRIRRIVRRLRKNVTVKAVMPGPYTFLKMCENKYYSSKEELMMDVAESLGDEASMLEKLGTRIIEVHEPILSSVGVDKDIFIRCFEAFSSRFSAKIWLQTYFGRIGMIEELSKLRIDVLGLDLVEAPDQLEGIMGLDSSLGIGLGAVDSRSTRIESVSRLRAVIRRVADRFEKIYLTPNAMMDFIPVSVAFVKLRRMGLAVRRIGK